MIDYRSLDSERIECLHWECVRVRCRRWVMSSSQARQPDRQCDEPLSSAGIFALFSRCSVL